MRTDDELTTRWLLPCDVHDFAAMYDFQNVVYDLWFAPYRRITNNDSSGFEHVFVGEEKDGAEKKQTRLCMLHTTILPDRLGTDRAKELREERRFAQGKLLACTTGSSTTSKRRRVRKTPLFGAIST
jgi:hypothetical protein